MLFLISQSNIHYDAAIYKIQIRLTFGMRT